MGEPGGENRLRRALRRLSADRSELEAEDLQEHTESCGATPVVRCGNRQRVTVAGTLRSVTLRPLAGVPALEAELYDGSGTVTLTWLGRRRIGGVEPGRRLVVQGRISFSEGRRAMFNPAYELRPPGG